MEFRKEDLDKLKKAEDDFINNSLPDDNCDHSFSEVIPKDDLWLLAIL